MLQENDEIRQEQMREMALLNSFDKNPEAAALATTTILGGRGLFFTETSFSGTEKSM